MLIFVMFLLMKQGFLLAAECDDVPSKAQVLCRGRLGLRGVVWDVPISDKEGKSLRDFVAQRVMACAIFCRDRQNVGNITFPDNGLWPRLREHLVLDLQKNARVACLEGIAFLRVEDLQKRIRQWQVVTQEVMASYPGVYLEFDGVLLRGRGAFDLLLNDDFSLPCS